MDFGNFDSTLFEKILSRLNEEKNSKKVKKQKSLEGIESLILNELEDYEAYNFPVSLEDCQLKSLEINGFNYEEECIEPNALFKSLSKNQSITSFRYDLMSLGKDGVCDEFIEFLTKNRTLRLLGIVNDEIGRYGAQKICESLVNHPFLNTFDIRLNRTLQDEGIYHIAELLNGNKTITYVDLESTNFSQKGAEYLGNAISSNSILQIIDISHNGFGNQGLLSILNGLKSNKSIKTIKMNDISIFNDGSKILANYLRNYHTLEILSLEKNNLNDNDITLIFESFRNNQNLTNISLRDNTFSDEGVKKIFEVLPSTNIKVLSIGKFFDSKLCQGSSLDFILEYFQLNGSLRELSFDRLFTYQDVFKQTIETVYCENKIFHSLTLNYNLLSLNPCPKICKGFLSRNVIQSKIGPFSKILQMSKMRNIHFKFSE